VRVNNISELDELQSNQVKKEPKRMVSFNQHFIFNTLNSIVSLCRVNPEEARKVVLELSSYLRFNTNVTDELIFLCQEIEYIKSYLYIQKIRFGERLNIIYNIEENINFLIPKNSLYNLIDNAINHGILKKNYGGTLTLMVKQHKEKVVINIKDDGVGMEGAQIIRILNNEKCGSLSTLNSQYEKLYNAKLEISSKLRSGTYITINIPIENVECG